MTSLHWTAALIAHYGSRFKFFALVRPSNDILPVRTLYNGVTQNIGINYLTSDEPIWFAGPELIAAILLSGGKVPHIEEAYCLVSRGKQDGRGTTNLRSLVEVDANKDSLFKHVIEQRAANEANKSLHYFLKILASSGSYGLFVELNPNENSKHLAVKVFSGEDRFTDTWGQMASHVGSKQVGCSNECTFLRENTSRLARNLTPTGNRVKT
jgi:hypothetical protein